MFFVPTHRWVSGFPNIGWTLERTVFHCIVTAECLVSLIADGLAPISLGIRFEALTVDAGNQEFERRYLKSVHFR